MIKKFILLIFISTISFSQKLNFEYFIQINSTKYKEKLLKIEKEVQGFGYNYIVKERFKNDILYYRVLVGPYETKELAKAALPLLKKEFRNKSAYISKFKKDDELSKKIKLIKENGYKAYIKRDFLLMNSYLEEAASLGDKESQYYIAKNYHFAIGIEQNINNAIKWYEECKDVDYKCLDGLSSIYSDYTLNRKPDLKKAFSYLEKSVKMGSKRAKVLLENRKNIEKIDKLLSSEKITIKLIETLLYAEIKNSKIENIQIANQYKQDDAENLNITLILNKKVKDVFMILKKDKFGYWKTLELKIY